MLWVHCECMINWQPPGSLQTNVLWHTHQWKPDAPWSIFNGAGEHFEGPSISAALDLAGTAWIKRLRAEAAELLRTADAFERDLRAALPFILPQPEVYMPTAQTPVSNFMLDPATGNPAGGTTHGPGYVVQWQNGPLVNPDGTARPRNGAFVEEILMAAQQRIEHYQTTKFVSDDNAEALAKIEEALVAIRRRSAKREAAGILGTHKVG